MGLIAASKGEMVKAFLGKLTNGDTGSSIIGVIAGGALASGISFSDLFSSDGTKQAQAIGLLTGAVVMAVWGWYTGKKKPESPKG